MFGGIYIGIWLYERHQKNKPAVVISSKSLDDDLGGLEDDLLDDLEETKDEDEFSGDEEDEDDEEIF